MLLTTIMTEATARAADDCRNKQVQAQTETSMKTPEQNGANVTDIPINNNISPPLSRRRVSLRRKQIIEKRRNNRIASPTPSESPTTTKKKSVVVMNDEEKKEQSPQTQTCPNEDTANAVVATTSDAKESPCTSDVIEEEKEYSTGVIHNNDDVEANTALEEDRNDKVDTTSAWDTRSIHEFPLEPAVDPTWDPSKTSLFDETQEAALQEQMDALGMDTNVFNETTAADDFLPFESGDAFATFAKKPETTAENKEEPTNDEVKQSDANVSNDSASSEAAPLTVVLEGGMKMVDCSLDVHMGCVEDKTALASLSDRLLHSTENETVVRSTNESDKDATAEGQVDFSSTDLDNPQNVLKDDEALLGSDQVRSDVADGPESDAADAIRLLNQVEQQKRIVLYKERSEDSSSVSGDEEDSQEDSEDFDDEEEIRYISADSEEEEQIARQVNSFSVPEIVGDKSVQGASFGAAASAALDATAAEDGSRPQSENDEIPKTTSSSSASGRGDSVAVDSSMASSSLLGASLAGTSVTSEVTASSGGVSAAFPPPPPPSQPPKKKSSKRSNKKQSSKKQKPLFKIPPPSPEKLKRWEEEKLRPKKHLQAVAEAKAKSSEQSANQEYQLKEAASSEYASLSLMTSVSSSHSQEEIETTLDTSIAEEYSAMIADAERSRDEDATQKRNQLDEADRSTLLNVSHMTQTTQDVSFPDARSLVRDDATSIATSFAVLSPPHVSRTKLDEAAGLAPGEDGIWKEDNVKKTPKVKNKSALSDKKMAERLAVASSTAARKFEERYGNVDEEALLAHSTSSESKKPKGSFEKGGDPEERPDVSYFCAPDMLGGTSFCQPSSGEAQVESSDGNLLSRLSTKSKGWATMDSNDGDNADAQRSILDSSFDDTHHAGMELVGGAFSTWKNSDYAYGSDVGAKDPAQLKESLERAVNAAAEDVRKEELQLLSWLENDVLHKSTKSESQEVTDCGFPRERMLSLLQKDAHFNTLCGFASVNVFLAKPSDDSSDPSDNDNSEEQAKVAQDKTSVYPFLIPTGISKRPHSSMLAANFISFLNRISLLSGMESPFKEVNPFVLDVVSTSLQSGNATDAKKDVAKEQSVQELIFNHELGDVVAVVRFFYQACRKHEPQDMNEQGETTKTQDEVDSADETQAPPRIEELMPLFYQIPTQSPSPFETASWNLPSIVAIVLGFLGDPVAVCRMKMVNHFCNRLIQENEHVIMRDAVRLGGIGMHIRPAFWMWITLEKCGRAANAIGAREVNRPDDGDESQLKCITTVLPELEKRGREGKWHHVIQRDVARAFGNMPPHKTSARLRTDSIVRALVTWGRGRVLMRGVKGGGVSSPTPVIPPPGIEKAKSKPRLASGPPPWERGDSIPEKEEDSQGPPDTVSQWSGISPVPSFCSNSGQSDTGETGSAGARANLANGVAKALEGESSKPMKNSRAIEELALSGNTLTTEMKEGLQNQLGYILHALAAAHDDVGYCQGMDYVVAHLLRVLQDTVRWHSVRGTLSPSIKSQPKIPKADSDERSLTKEIDQAIDSSLVVEETVFRVMDTFLTTYNLRHMYWPELRCLKTCCRVFERLIQLKLPVLADHFAYHELNVGLFALGWFQTLFLYLPSMPSATVCHMWDIWLVERSFKIFFRVGTAILFLSQPILLNHELEGMMTYLNTFPDATLLNPDILIACALQIKVTNRMLEDIERDLTSGGY